MISNKKPVIQTGQSTCAIQRNRLGPTRLPGESIRVSIHGIRAVRHRAPILSLSYDEVKDFRIELMPDQIFAVLLAAGAGRRFGGDKLLAPLGGRPLVAHAAAALAESMAQGVIAGGVAVVPPRATALAWSLDTAGLTLLENPNPAAGLSSSLKVGIAQVARWSKDLPRSAALVVLADQPDLRSAVIARLVETWRVTGQSVRPRYAGAPETPGHPVLLDRALWSLCDRLAGDQGFRDLLASQPIKIVDVEGRNPDVDTPEDLHEIEGRP